MRTVLLALSLLMGFAVAAPAQRAPYIPTRGSVERTMIMDAFRIPITRELGRAAVFHEVQMRVQNGWAFVMAVPRSPEGGRLIDLDHPDCVNCTDNVAGLLRWRGNRWVVVAYVVAPGEMPYEWQEQHPAPRGIFPWNWPSR